MKTLETLKLSIKNSKTSYISEKLYNYIIAYTKIEYAKKISKKYINENIEIKINDIEFKIDSLNSQKEKKYISKLFNDIQKKHIADISKYQEKLEYFNSLDKNILFDEFIKIIMPKELEKELLKQYDEIISICYEEVKKNSSLSNKINISKENILSEVVINYLKNYLNENDINEITNNIEIKKNLEKLYSDRDKLERNLVAIPLTLDDGSRLKKLFSKIIEKH